MGIAARGGPFDAVGAWHECPLERERHRFAVLAHRRCGSDLHRWMVGHAGHAGHHQFGLHRRERDLFAEFQLDRSHFRCGGICRWGRSGQLDVRERRDRYHRERRGHDGEKRLVHKKLQPNVCPAKYAGPRRHPRKNDRIEAGRC